MAPNDDYEDDVDEEEDDEEEQEEEDGEEEVEEPAVEEEVEEEDDEPEEVEEVQKPASRKRTKKFKDPNKPKKAMSAFFLYSQANRARVKEENPDAKFGEIAKILSQQFKALPEKETRKWAKKAETEKDRYKEEMQGYTPKDEPPKKDPKAPKRNMSAYLLYSIHERPKVKEENPDASFGEIAKLISARFKALSKKDRKIWDQKAEEDKKRYAREMEVYNHH